MFSDQGTYNIFWTKVDNMRINADDIIVDVPEGFSSRKVNRNPALFTWDPKRSSSKLVLDNENLTCKVREGSGFKTTLGTEVFEAGGRYYFELFINKGHLIKIGVCRLDINLEEVTDGFT